MSAVITIARVSLLRLLRDRSNIFFVFIFPMMLVLLIGLAFGDAGSAVIGVAGAEARASDRFTAELETLDLVVDPYTDADDLRDDVARGSVDAGAVVVVEDGRTTIEYLAGPDSAGALLRATVEAAAARVGNQQRAVAVVMETTGLPPERADELVTRIADVVPGVEVDVVQAGETAFEGFEELGMFGFGAVGQLLLFVFVTSLAGAAALIQTRQLGVARRMLAAPLRTSSIIGGQALGRFAVALVQAAYIVAGTALLFDVEWGDPMGTTAVILLFCLVSAAGGMLVGALVDNDAQASGIGVLAGIGLAALGGSMLPLELFSPTMLRIAHATPHAWAQDAFAELLRRGGDITDVLPELGVLAAMAAVLLSVASWALHRSIVRA